MTREPTHTIHVPPLNQAERIDKFLLRHYPETSRAYWRKNLDSLVRINGKKARKGMMVRGSEQIEVLTQPVRELSLIPITSLDIEILHEDLDFLAILKPAGLPCHPLADAPDKPSVAGALAARYPELQTFKDKPLEGGLVHRLDNETSGVLLFARNEASLDKLRILNKAGAIHKSYLALTQACGPSRGHVGLAVAHHPKNLRKMLVVSDPTEAAKLKARSARSDFRRIRQSETHTLYVVRIRKGRRHQIRVHLAALGNPIEGDTLYASRPHPDAPRQLLHARKLVFAHPLTGKHIAIRAPLPADFRAALQRYLA